MNITLPELSLVVLVGASGCGKSTFARRHFRPTEIISSDYCRGLVADDENDQSATADAFGILYTIVGKRLKNGRLAVVDATNVRPEDRKGLVQLARAHHCFPVAIVLDLAEQICRERNAARPDRDFGPHVIRNQVGNLRRSLRNLEREGFRYVFLLRSPEEVDAVAVERQPLWNNKKTETGPFDIVGDVHGCFDELGLLLERLGYRIETGSESWRIEHPQGRKLVFVGDLVDRGPRVPDVLRLAMAAVNGGNGYCVVGNHDAKLVKALRGKPVRISHGLAESLAQLSREPDAFRAAALNFLDGLVSHYVFDGGRLVVAHAGLREEMHGRGSGAVREFALYGETTGETDEYGLPVRHDWAADYRGRAVVVYGHTPVPRAEWFNNTLCLDTGCVFGGALTALRYPERELVSAPALRTYYKPLRPLEPAPVEALSAQQQADERLDLADFSGKRILHPRLGHGVTIQAENAAAALEVMTRFAANPKWLVYLPPTMSPAETSALEGFLEHPCEALDYLPAGRSRGGGLPGKAHGVAGGGGRRPGRGSGPRPLRRRRRGARHRLHPHRAALFHRRPLGAATARPPGRGAGRSGVLGGVRHRLVRAGWRADALVAQGPRAVDPPVRGGRRGQPGDAANRPRPHRRRRPPGGGSQRAG
jgi:protein phosphatase